MYKTASDLAQRRARQLWLRDLQGVTIGGKVNNARLKQIEDSQTGIAKKVLSAIPIAEAWSVKQVVMEIARCGSAPDPRIVDGCINSLRDSGLVKEPRRGMFQRVATKEEKPLLAAVETPARSEAYVELVRADVVERRAGLSKPLDPLDRFGVISRELRELSTSASKLALAIEEAALDMEGKVCAAKEGAKKLDQLRDLLKSVSE